MSEELINSILKEALDSFKLQDEELETFPFIYEVVQ